MNDKPIVVTALGGGDEFYPKSNRASTSTSNPLVEAFVTAVQAAYAKAELKPGDIVRNAEGQVTFFPIPIENLVGKSDEGKISAFMTRLRTALADFRDDTGVYSLREVNVSQRKGEIRSGKSGAILSNRYALFISRKTPYEMSKAYGGTEAYWTSEQAGETDQDDNLDTEVRVVGT